MIRSALLTVMQIELFLHSLMVLVLLSSAQRFLAQVVFMTLRKIENIPFLKTRFTESLTAGEKSCSIVFNTIQASISGKNFFPCTNNFTRGNSYTRNLKRI